MVKYDPPKSVAWTRNVHLLSNRLSEARSAWSDEVKASTGASGQNQKRRSLAPMTEASRLGGGWPPSPFRFIEFGLGAGAAARFSYGVARQSMALNDQGFQAAGCLNCRKCLDHFDRSVVENQVEPLTEGADADRL